MIAVILHMSVSRHSLKKSVNKSVDYYKKVGVNDLIISVSRRADIPAFYSECFLIG